MLTGQFFLDWILPEADPEPRIGFSNWWGSRVRGDRKKGRAGKESKLREIVKDREAWRAVVHGVTKSQTQLSDWTTTTNNFPEVPSIYDLDTIYVPICGSQIPCELPWNSK